MLVSNLVSSSEVWYGITKKDYSKIENVDEMFIRRVFNVQSTVAKESLFIETGKMPIKYIIKMRRVMY